MQCELVRTNICQKPAKSWCCIIKYQNYSFQNTLPSWVFYYQNALHLFCVLIFRRGSPNSFYYALCKKKKKSTKKKVQSHPNERKKRYAVSSLRRLWRRAKPDLLNRTNHQIPTTNRLVNQTRKKKYHAAIEVYYISSYKFITSSLYKYTWSYIWLFLFFYLGCISLFN